MRKQDGYGYSIDEKGTRYEFVSTGPKGKIVKVVEFANLKFAYNLAFGDLTQGKDFDDSNISNNGDIRKVLQTVVNIIHHFCEENPGQKIYIEPVDKQRRALYNRIFKEKHEEISAFFQVTGIFLSYLSKRKLFPS
jgi:hypothetical protein